MVGINLTCPFRRCGLLSQTFLQKIYSFLELDFPAGNLLRFTLSGQQSLQIQSFLLEIFLDLHSLVQYQLMYKWNSKENYDVSCNFIYISNFLLKSLTIFNNSDQNIHYKFYNLHYNKKKIDLFYVIYMMYHIFIMTYISVQILTGMQLF